MPKGKNTTTSTLQKNGETDLNKSNLISLCSECDAEVTEETEGVQCELCMDWSHPDCVGITQSEMKHLNNLNIHWYCVKCNSIATDMIKALGSLKTQQVKLTDSYNDLKVKLKSDGSIFHEIKQQVLTEINQNISNEVKTATTKLKDEIKKEIKLNPSEIDEDSMKTLKSKLKEEALLEIKGTVKNTVSTEQEALLKNYAKAAAKDLKIPTESQLPVLIKTAVKDESVELERIKKRQKNLIIHNLAESDEPGEDAQKFDDIVKGILRIRNAEIESYTRLGTRNNEKPRLLRVTLKERAERKEILARAPQLRQVDEDDEFAKVYIRPDLTPQQLEQSKNLYMKLKEVREQEPTKKWKIQKGEIVEVPQ